MGANFRPHGSIHFTVEQNSDKTRIQSQKECEVPVCAAELSKCELSFDSNLRCLIEKYTHWWQESEDAFPVLPLTLYTPEDQASNESRARLLVDSMEEEFRNYPDEERLHSAWRARMLGSLRRFGKSFGFLDSHFDIVFSEAYLEATRAFVRKARIFDPAIKTDALAQALRNVWVMNSLQLLHGFQPSLTPSVFAYSMLYPYTDNHLDLPTLSAQSKEIVCRRLSLRLSGVKLPPSDEDEAAVFDLIGMIEGEFARGSFPEIYASLLAIHEGQIQSLRQQQKSNRIDKRQLLAISILKGGSSVLADGWLAVGRLTRDEEAFSFGFGVVLQLLDDLQDLQDDRAAGHSTLFTCAATEDRLDSITSQLWKFMHKVFDLMDRFELAQALEVKDLIRRNSAMLMMRSMAECADLYSSEFLEGMERFAPIRFDFMKETRKDIQTRFKNSWPAWARRRKLHSIFDLMG
jgi:hypothetical protein